MTSRSVVTRQKQATAQQHYATTAADQEQAEYRAASAFLQQQDTTVSKKNKLTPAMRTCLMDLQASLTCPLCSQVLVQPVSLPCAHTFCCTCIDGHVDNSWNCPIKTCNMPVSMKNAHQGKFRNINSATQTAVSSWSKICHTLMRAEDGWWKDKPTSNQDDGDDEDIRQEDDATHASPKDTTNTQDDEGTFFATAEEDDDAYSL